MAFIAPGGDSGRYSKYFLGLHRHEWGTIHLYFCFSEQAWHRSKNINL